jgi:hypothetical protein
LALHALVWIGFFWLFSRNNSVGCSVVGYARVQFGVRIWLTVFGNWWWQKNWSMYAFTLSSDCCMTAATSSLIHSSILWIGQFFPLQWDSFGVDSILYQYCSGWRKIAFPFDYSFLFVLCLAALRTASASSVNVTERLGFFCCAVLCVVLCFCVFCVNGF